MPGQGNGKAAENVKKMVGLAGAEMCEATGVALHSHIIISSITGLACQLKLEHYSFHGIRFQYYDYDY